MQTFEISIAEWHQLAAGGAAPALRVPLIGHSMQPLVRKMRDIVTILPVSRPLRKGDIVLFRRADGVYVVHRLIRIEKDAVQTLGDNCPRPDAPLPISEVLGIVTHVQRGKRTLHVDTPSWRWAGRLWSAILPVRNCYRSCRRFIARPIKRLLGRNEK